MKRPARRLQRIAEKLRLRLKLGWAFATGYEDANHRARHRVSFSQCGEDMIAWFLFSLRGIDRPRYLDIGAHHPTYLSNTALFSLLGARGLNVEPDPGLFAAFPLQRPRDINLNIGIAETAGEMTFYRMSDPTLNTFSQEEAERLAQRPGFAIRERVRLPVEPIASVLARHQFVPDFVSIDVEGRDLDILRTYDFERHRPLVICAETLEFQGAPAGRKNTDLIEFLQARGFAVYADTHINTIFLDERPRPAP